MATNSSGQISNLVLLKVEGPIAYVSFNEPASRNALNDASRLAFAEALNKVADNDDVRVVVLRGEGTAFSSGGDLRIPSTKIDLARKDPYAYMQMELEEEENIQNSIFRLNDKIVLAALNGPAIGQGFEVAMFADYRVSVASARFAFTQVQMDLIPPFAMGPLRHLTSISEAMRLILLGEYFDAVQAKQLGLVDQVVADAEFDATIRDLAERFAQVPVGVVYVVKRWFNTGVINGAHEALGAAHYAQFFLRGFPAASESRNRLRKRVLRRADLKADREP